MKRMVTAFLVALSVGACTGDSSSDGPRPDGTRDAESSPGPDGYGPARMTGRIRDEHITESSGIVASATRPGTFWTHNDSGGEPVLFCLHLDGASCGTVDVEGAGAVDWEDIARGPGPTPDMSYLYIGDIGDNTASRESVTVYRVLEPAPGSQSEDAETLSLHYPDGPHDAETLMVHPKTGDLYIVSKGAEPVVYVARAPLAPSMELEVAGRARIPGLLPGPTGGDISPDGRRVVLSLYTGAVEFVGTAAHFDAIWRTKGSPITLPPVAQREAIAYSLDGRSVVTTSEGRRAPIHRATRP